MAVRIRIATKILMLAVSLLLLTVALSFFSSLQTHQLREDQQRISTLYIPLSELMDDLHVNGLKRLLAFEHWLGLITAARPLPRAIDAASGPDTRTAPMPPRPGGVAAAAMVAAGALSGAPWPSLPPRGCG